MPCICFSFRLISYWSCLIELDSSPWVFGLRLESTLTQSSSWSIQDRSCCGVVGQLIQRLWSISELAIGMHRNSSWLCPLSDSQRSNYLPSWHFKLFRAHLCQNLTSQFPLYSQSSSARRSKREATPMLFYDSPFADYSLMKRSLVPLWLIHK